MRKSVLKNISSLLIMVMVIISLILTLTKSSQGVEKAPESLTRNLTPKEIVHKTARAKENDNEKASDTMIFKDGKLTVKISAALREVMERIRELTGVEISWLKTDADEKVTLGFSGRSLEEGIQHILQDKSYMLFYRSTAEGERLAKILILPQANEWQEANHRLVPYNNNMQPDLIKAPSEIRKWFPANQSYNSSAHYREAVPMTRGERDFGEEVHGEPPASPVPNEMAEGSRSDNFQTGNRNATDVDKSDSPGGTYGTNNIKNGQANENVNMINKLPYLWDDFEDGDDKGWKPRNEDHWRVEDIEEDGLAYTVLPSDSQMPSVSLRTDIETADTMTISVKARGQSLPDGSQTNFYIVFGSDELNGRAYFAGARVDLNTWIIEERSITEDFAIALAEDSTEIIRSSTWYDLKLIISGTSVDLYAKESADSDYGSPKASFDFTHENGFPDGLPIGGIGLGGFSNHAQFDDFCVMY